MHTHNFLHPNETHEELLFRLAKRDAELAQMREETKERCTQQSKENLVAEVVALRIWKFQTEEYCARLTAIIKSNEVTRKLFENDCGS